MHSVIAIVEANKELRDKLRQACIDHNKIHVIASVSSFNELRDYINTQRIDMVLVGNEIVGSTPIKTIEEIIKHSPLPILYVKLKSDKDNVYPKILNLGFVEGFEIEVEDEAPIFENIVIPKMIPIKCVILSKLNIKRFLYQVDKYFNDENFEPRFLPNKDSKKLAKAMDIIKRRIVSTRGTFTSKDVIVIGASTGGPTILQNIVQNLPREMPPILMVQHMPTGFVESFAKRLDNVSKLCVKTAQQNEMVKRNHVYLAPGGKHMEVVLDEQKSARILLSDGAMVNFVKPSVDVTLFAAARIWGSGVLSVILTGMGKDGREGTRIVKKQGGRSVVLNEYDSVIYGMNKSVVEAGLADEILPLRDIPLRLAEIYGYKLS